MEHKQEVVILAGGAGSRLAPITDDLPKPLVPVGGVPALTRLTACLRENGWTEALLTVCALPEAFERYHDPHLRLHVRQSALPLGSAGSVREVREQLAQTVLVLSGDNVFSLTEPDALRKAYERHIAEHRHATLLLTRASEPGEFGVVSLDGSRIIGFSEKPSWRDTFSDLVSTGIYILDRSVFDHVPADLCFDFGKDLFPRLLAENIPLHGERLPGSWWDIGTPDSYYRCCMALSGGENVIGEECVLENGARVSRSVLHDRVRVNAGAHVEGSILCAGVTVGENCVVPPGCVIGENTLLEQGAELRPGVHLKGGLLVRAHAVIGERFRFGDVSKRLFGDECITGTRSELDSGFCVQLGRALKTPGRNRRIGVLHGASASARLYAELLARGAQDAGASVWELGDAFPAVTAFAVRQYDLDMAIFVDVQESTGKVYFRFCDQDGLPLSRQMTRECTKRFTDETFDTCFTPQPRTEVSREDRLLCRYCEWLQEQVGSLRGVTFSVSRRDDAGEFLYANASELGANVSYGEQADTFTVSPDGRRACAYTASGKALTYWHLVAIAAAESDTDVITLPARVPQAVESYLQNMGKTVHCYTDGTDACRKDAFKNPYVQDGVLLCLLVAKRLQARQATLDDALASLPVFFVRKKELPLQGGTEAADRRASRIGALTRNGHTPARVFLPNGCVTFFANASGGYTLLAETTFGTQDAVEALCDAAERLLQ